MSICDVRPGEPPSWLLASIVKATRLDRPYRFISIKSFVIPSRDLPLLVSTARSWRELCSIRYVTREPSAARGPHEVSAGKHCSIARKQEPSASSLSERGPSGNPIPYCSQAAVFCYSQSERGPGRDPTLNCHTGVSLLLPVALTGSSQEPILNCYPSKSLPPSAASDGHSG